MQKSFEGYLLVTDMDGTLLNSEGRISDRNKRAIESFVQRGGLFTIATGRMREAVRRYVKDLSVQAPVIIYNGTKIYDYSREETIFESFLEEQIKEMLRKIKDYDSTLGIEVYCEENVHIFSPCRFTDRFSKKGYEVYYEVSDSLWEKNWTKVLMIGEEDQVDRLEEIFQGQFGAVNLIRSGENYLEIAPKGTSKGQAMEKLCELFDIDKQKTIAVGDNMNDYEMVNSAAWGFCVANGSKRLIAAAKHICADNNDHALEDVISIVERELVEKSKNN